MPIIEFCADDELFTDSQTIAAESIGWIPLDARVYFHHGAKSDLEPAQEILVVGIPDITHAGLNVLLLT